MLFREVTNVKQHGKFIVLWQTVMISLDINVKNLTMKEFTTKTIM